MSEVGTESENDSDFDEVLWQAWKAMELPEGYRAEIIEGAIEVSPTARLSHGLITNRVRRALDKFSDGGEYACHQGVNEGSVTLCTGPRPDKADWEDIHRVYYGTDVTIPEGPAKGFVIGDAITGPKRS